MPQSVVDQIIVQKQEGYEMLDTNAAWLYKLLSHVLDILGHPVIVYLFWRIHKSYGGNWQDLLSWPVIIMAWHTSRLWSFVHSFHNKGTWDIWYFGHDVYVLNDTNVYLTAYVAEGLCFGGVVGWKLLFEGWSPLSPDSVIISDLARIKDDEREKDDPKPMLVHSESAFSTSSVVNR